METRFEFMIRRPADRVFYDLADPDRFAARHPLIYRMERNGPDRLKVFEKIKFGPVGLPFSYPATFKADLATRTLRIDAMVHGMVAIDMEISVVPEGSHCVLRETLLIRSSLPVKSRLSRFIRQQHALMCKNLESANDDH
jgi:carbon monoxide dehydrogenase subunit G